MVGYQNSDSEAPPMSKKGREKKKMSGEERLPEERWRRVGMSGSLKGMRS